MVKAITLFFLLASINIANGQSDTTKESIRDTITFKGEVGAREPYSFKGKDDLQFRDIRTLLKIDKTNEKIIANADALNVFSTVLSLAGSFCVGYAMANSFTTGKSMNWPILSTGVGLLLINIPISSLYGRNVKKAIRHYNSLQ